MNEIDTQIMKIIETCMNKTLSEGCYIEGNSNLWIYKITHTKGGKFHLIGNWKKAEYVIIKKLKEVEDIKILWHYDITAVLKYVKENWWFAEAWYKNRLDELDILYIEIWRWTVEDKIRQYIPIKPLHLYTIEEKKALLKILKELWTTNSQK